MSTLDEVNRWIYRHAHERDRHQWLVDVLTRYRAKVMAGLPAAAEAIQYADRLDALKAATRYEQDPGTTEAQSREEP